ncbi:MAG: penicillin-binding protein activator [Xanthomonadales bacterium]|nr:penicillin-binding protein activator [Xanthomonadales bacterium]
MNLRFFLLTLSVIVLATMAGCATTTTGTGTRQQQAPPVQDSSMDRGSRDRASRGLLDPSNRTVDQVIEMSRNMDAEPLGLALEIVRSLETVPSSRLANMIETQVYDPEFTEWLELTLLVRESLVRQAPVNAAQYWQDFHYGHIIDRARFQTLVSSYSSFFPTPDRVAVLLPFNGGLAAAGRAIRDGIISAYMEQPGGSAIRFYPSGDDNESALAAYHQAVRDGALLIVGPLRVESVQTLAGLENHAVPLLLLNDPGTGQEAYPQQPGISSLSLSQTEEAAAIAERALTQGQQRAVMIVPESNWGQRIEAAFGSAFVRGQGQISASAYFNPSASDHSAVLTDVLKIDESKQRKQALQSRLGIPLEFEPIRRQDFDFIFLAADSKQGRELKPLLKFHNAGDVPVYAMSRVYSGRAELDSDRDLDGVIFPVTPWQLQAVGKPLPDLESLRDGSFGNLFALGRDAWQILPWLPLLAKDPDLEFHGNTGALTLQADGHLSRQPAWARFSAGRPIPYLWPDQH